MSEGLPHHAENPQQKKVGIFISVLAVIMAIVSAVTNKQANEMLAKKVESSNGYAFFQAKKQRSHINEIEIKRLDYELAGLPTEAQRELIKNEKADLVKANKDYEPEMKKIRSDADADKTAAELAEHRHHWFELSEICLHIAVVLCSLVLLTEMKVFLRLGIIVTVAGLAIAGYAQFANHSHYAGNEGHAAPAAKPAGAPAH